MQQMMEQFGFWFLPAILLISVWSVIWKGMALWKSAQAKQKAWFVVMLIVNTLGILEILYLFIFSKMKKSK